jgi:hypothetical protein
MDPQFLKNPLHMAVNGPCAYMEQFSDFLVGLTFAQKP